MKKLEYDILLSIADGMEPFEMVYSDVTEWSPEISDQDILGCMFELQYKKIIKFLDMNCDYELLEIEQVKQRFSEQIKKYLIKKNWLEIEGLPFGLFLEATKDVRDLVTSPKYKKFYEQNTSSDEDNKDKKTDQSK